MGDRANVVVMTKPHPVYLYSHWGGRDLPLVVQDALRRGPDRWSDDSYLTRIIFSEMIKDSVEGTTGFGIGTQAPDNEHDLVMVFPENRSQGNGFVAFVPTVSGFGGGEMATPSVSDYDGLKKKWSLQQFVNASRQEIMVNWLR